MTWIRDALTDDGDPDAPDVTIERREWSPTPAEMARYQVREAELARGNIVVARAHGGSSVDTLHSRDVLWRVVQGLS